MNFGGSRLLSAQFSTTDILVASTIGTTETAFATQFQFPASYWTANKLVEVRAVFGWIATATVPTTLPKLRLRKAGPTDYYLYTGVAQAQAAFATEQGFMCSWMLQGTGAPGAAVNLETGYLGEGFGGFIRNTIAQGVAVDTTAALTLALTLTFGAATAGNQLALRQLVLLEHG
ncbi:MAG: hypothetical protein JWM95_538 [Gemmatimonadetes bacterium]|nr:hypothetical protein [Gemmatimonadota bacterium]